MSETRRNPGFGTRPFDKLRAAPSTVEGRDSGLGTQHARLAPPDALDAAIDAVAREMTESEPSGALRARVLERIAAEGTRGTAAVPRWAWAAAAGALMVAVATTVWINRPQPAPGDASTRAAGQRAAVPAPRAAAQTTIPAQPEIREAYSSAAPANQRAFHGLRTASVPANRGGGLGNGAAGRAAADFAALVPALTEITPLAFSRVEPVPLDVNGVDMMPLDIAPIPDIPVLEPGQADARSFDPTKEKQP